ncbi:MAG: hypothetical protein J6X18_07980 [Bacteroidales bacterium]|nr:hypothetical protein [Bacteroidales bacterium]
MKKLTTEEVLNRIKKVHGDYYDLSKIVYQGLSRKITVICPKHGEFSIRPHNFINGEGCRLCGNEKLSKNKTKTTPQFIEEARVVHGDKYDYSKVEYVNCDEKVCIICPEHGEFWQTPYLHLNTKNGCKKCSGKYQYTTEEYVEKAKRIHNNKYTYENTEYISAFEPICITCPKHGKFWQAPANHLQGVGCPKCKGKHKTTEDFINEIKENGYYREDYDYSNVEYTGAFDVVRMTCKKHGDFLIRAHDLLRGHGCAKCGFENSSNIQRLSVEEFVKNAKKKHGEKYDYSKVEYLNAKTPVCLVCPKHGNFYVTPNKHTSRGVGCPKCNESALETELRVYCEKNKIKHEEQKRFTWLGLQRYDFYLPDYNIAIECQGVYHFEPYKKSKNDDADENLLSQIKREELKYEITKENNLNILYYIPEFFIKKKGISKIYEDDTIIFTKPENLKEMLEVYGKQSSETISPSNQTSPKSH